MKQTLRTLYKGELSMASYKVGALCVVLKTLCGLDSVSRVSEIMEYS